MDIIKLATIVETLLSKQALSGLINYFRSFSISSFIINNRLNNIEPKIMTMIDVGSNIGQFTTAFHLFNPNANIYCIEPDPNTFQVLKKNLLKINRLELMNIALGDEEGRLSFYKHDYTHISSMLKISENNIHPKYENAKTEEMKVDVYCLDNLTNLNIKSPSVLKLDVQGFELKVLLGARKTLEKIDYVLLEIAFDDLYEGQPSFHQIHVFLIDSGFNFLSPLNFHNGANSMIIEMDALYKRCN